VSLGLPADLGLAAASAWCFGVIYQCGPRTALAAAGLAAAGWAASDLLAGVPHLAVLPDFAGALVVGGGAEVMAMVRREPVTLMVVPAVIPFVPGYEAYRSMIAFIQNEFVAGLERGLSALLAATAIAMGLGVASALTRALLRRLGRGARPGQA